MPATFDGDNLTITLPVSTSEVDAQVDLYSDWKEWVKLSDNAKFPPAFDTVGGDPVSATQNVAPYFFLRNDNGWRIAPAEEDATVVVTGNLYPRDSTLAMIVPTTGAFTVLVNIDRSSSALVVVSEEVVNPLDEVVEGTLTLAQIQRILLAAMAGKISGAPSGPINIRDVADAKNRIVATVDGSGNRTAITTLDGT